MSVWASWGLPADEVHVWYVPLDAIPHPAARAAYIGILDSVERARHQSFVFERNKHEYLVAHGLVRTTLSHYTGAAPGDWEFETSAQGRPEVRAPALDPPLRFSLSHTEGLVAAAFTLARSVGVDVESVQRRETPARVAEHSFSPAEVHSLRTLPPSEQRRRFFEIWTLKEAYIKARGMGLSLPLDKFSFDLDGSRIRISIDPLLEDDPADWQFFLNKPTPVHQLALAVRRGDTGESKVRLASALL